MNTFYSTNKQIREVSLKEAVLQGLAADGGLFMPNSIPSMDADFLERLPHLGLSEIAFEVSKKLLPHIPEAELKKIAESINFDAPLVGIADNLFALELFHGPTLSFKDFGAHFMAGLMGYFVKQEEQDLHILAATSGDTGSAVAHGFLGIPGIKVWILYPKGQVSRIQEQQLTTIGQNVAALEVEGTFDDCQALVKRAFCDQNLCQKIRMTSANSINIARLIPQSFYYFRAYGQLKAKNQKVVFSVPSGNFGNLTAGLLAKKMGLPIEYMIAATNSNDSVPRYLETGIFNPGSSKRTLSNAMDVGNPSNFARILDLYGANLETLRKDMAAMSYSDENTKEAMRELEKLHGYYADPHGAVGYLGLKEYRKIKDKDWVGIFLETAHPGKFQDIVESVIGKKIDLPKRLKECLEKPKRSIQMANCYDDLKSLLLSGG